MAGCEFVAASGSRAGVVQAGGGVERDPDGGIVSLHGSMAAWNLSDMRQVPAHTLCYGYPSQNLLYSLLTVPQGFGTLE